MNERFNPGSDSGDLNVSPIMDDNYHSNQSSENSVSLSKIRLAGLLAILCFSIASAAALVIWVQTGPDPVLSRLIDRNKTAGNPDIFDEADTSYQADFNSGNKRSPIDQADEVNHGFLVHGLSGDDIPMNKLRALKNLESEIARSIMTIQHIKTARVLLAIPETTESAKALSKPTASVMVHTDQGQSLKKSQKKAIIHLVAASVPKLEAERVTLIDHKGHLLNFNDSSPVPDLNAVRSEYKENFEEDLTSRITDILSTFVDAEGLRVQVSADLDYSGTGRSQEKNDAKLTDSLTNQSLLDQKVASDELTGPGSRFESANVNPQTGTAANSANISGSPRRVTKKKTSGNDEQQAAVSVTDMKANLRRLSVAVVVDDQKIIRTDGSVNYQPMGQDEIERYSALVKQSVGFDSSRGDQLILTHAAFKKPIQDQVKSEPPFWKQGWFYLMLKYLTLALALLLLFLGIINPLIRYVLGLSGDVRDNKTRNRKGSKSRDEAKEAVRFDQKGLPVSGLDNIEQSVRTAPDDVSALLLMDTPQNYQHRLAYMKQIADADAKLVAEVIKSWINKDG